MAADFCHVRVSLNGKTILTVEPFSPTTELDVTAATHSGDNQLAIIGEPVDGPSAVALSLHLTDASGKQTAIVTDGQWTAKGEKVAAMGAVRPELWGVNRRSIRVDPFENYEQWKQALGTGSSGSLATFWSAPGFEISLIRTAEADEGSWVSMAFDPRGRLTIAREEKGLLRMTLDEPRLKVSKVETLNDELLECRGLLYAHDALYANANNSKGMYRLRDTDGDDKLDEVRLLRTFPGGAGHGRNDLALGPDGKIYSIHGDSVELPAADITDRTSPFREARRGKKTSEGYVVRTDRDGKDWEVVCGGLRNPFGLAFGPAGDGFTYDADAEFDMGTPWYRPTRVVPLVSGADYGWRGVTGKWPPYFADHPDNGPRALDIGRGSPTAVAFGTQSKFPPSYRQALFVLDWTYGRILAVNLAPRGAGHRAEAETFVQGRPLNVTDLAFGPDGAMYVVTGGRKTQSALYKIAYTGRQVAETPPGKHEADCLVQAANARAIRQELEAFHGRSDPAALDAIWPYLDDADPTIRHAARIALEHQPVETWRERALDEKRTTAALTALMALARSGDEQSQGAVIDALRRQPLDKLDVTQVSTVLHSYSLCRQSAPQAFSQHRQEIAAQLFAAFDHWHQATHVGIQGTSRQLLRQLATLLVDLDESRAVPLIVKTLLASDVQEDQLQALFALRHARHGWTVDSRRKLLSVLNGAERFVGGEGMSKFVKTLRDEIEASLTDAERAALADLLQRKSDESDVAPLPPPRPTIKAWAIDDLAELIAKRSKAGDPARGATVFQDALCVRCHRVGARGPAVGPDLTHVSGRFSRRDILESILSPSKVVAENYRNVQVATKDGRILVGRVFMEGDYRSEKLRLATDPLRLSDAVELDKREIEHYKVAETSPMPQGLLDGFTQDEIRDLLAYLERGIGRDE